MKLDDPVLIDRLAQRYVIGTMWGRARDRFGKLAVARFDIRRRIDFWEERLTPLAWSLPPETPSALVWQRIRRELGFAAGGRERRTSGWAAIAASLALVAVVLGGGWWQAAQRPPEIVTETVIERVPEAVSVALVGNEAGESLWFVSLKPDSREITARVVAAPEARPDNDYQLWLLTADGTPLSLGLLPQSGERTLAVDTAAVAALGDSRMVAVSLEPEGGSPQAGPTGPVLYTAALITR